jgi:mitochondrial fission protein ELM1
VISDGSAGMVNQAWGLAETLGYEVELKKIRLRQPWETLAPYLKIGGSYCLAKGSDSLSSPYPELVLASGRRAILPALYIKKKATDHCKVVYLQDPRISPSHFDAVICPQHDGLAGENVIQTIGATHRISREKLLQAKANFQHLNPQNQPVFSVIIGGSTKKYTMDMDFTHCLTNDLLQISKKGWRVLVTLSRRTPQAVAEKIKLLPSPIYVWDGKGDNPYFGLLGLADALLVTCDSVSMISEVCATTVPVYLYPLPKVYWKHQQFHQSLLDLNRVRWWTGSPEPYDFIPLNVNQDTAVKLKRLLEL